MEPTIAITAPTERSTPPVAITSVIPIAASATGAARFSTSMRLPNSFPSRTASVRKPGAKIQLNSMSSASASSGNASLLSARVAPRNDARRVASRLSSVASTAA